MSTFISLATGPGDTFTNAEENDLLLYVSDPGRIVLGTIEGAAAQTIVGKSNTEITTDVKIAGSTFINSNLLVLGETSLDNLTIEGSLTIDNPTSDADVTIKSTAGKPNLRLKQSTFPPFTVYQSTDGQAYISNSNNINILSTNNINLGTPVQTSLSLTNQGYFGIGTIAPRTKLDVYDGNVNATNLIKLRKSSGESSNIDITLNWTNFSSNNYVNILFETIQQCNTTSNMQGTRIQKHKLFVSPSNVASYVAMSYGDHEVFGTLHIETLSVNSNSMIIRSNMNYPTDDFLHEFDLNVLLSSEALGPVWLF